MLRTERCTFCYDRCFRCFGKRGFLTPNGTYISHARDVHSFVFLGHITATLYMTGLIWFVQIVHYPLFSRVGNAEFPAYEQRHTVLTTWVVGPPMLVEGITALILFWLRPGGVTGRNSGSESVCWPSSGFRPPLSRYLVTTCCRRNSTRQYISDWFGPTGSGR